MGDNGPFGFDPVAALQDAAAGLHDNEVFMPSSTIGSIDYPETMKVVLCRHWQEAIDAEMAALERLGVWEKYKPEDVPAGHSAMGSRFVMRAKTDKQGFTIRYTSHVNHREKSPNGQVYANGRACSPRSASPRSSPSLTAACHRRLRNRPCPGERSSFKGLAGLRTPCNQRDFECVATSPQAELARRRQTNKRFHPATSSFA